MSKQLIEASNLMQQLRFDEAAALCRKALRKPADFVAAKRMLADCYNNQGFVQLQVGLPEIAEEHFKAALVENPRHSHALRNLTALLCQQGRDSESVAFFEKLAEQEPKNTTVLRDLSVAYQKLDRMNDAQRVLQSLQTLMPEDSSAQLRDILLVRSIIPDRAYIREVRDRIEAGLNAQEESPKRIDDPLWFPGTYFYLSYHGESNRAIHSRIAQTHLSSAPSLSWEAEHIKSWSGPKETRIRIGLASRFFYNHSIGHTSRELVERLNRDLFEVTVIHLGPGPQDAIRSAIDKAADRHIEASITDLASARQSIADQELDVLFWQDIGMEPISYLLAFSRLAPIQLTSFGHPDTTGIPNIDYFLSSALYETKNAQEHYSEQLVQIPGAGTLAYYHPPARPKTHTRKEFGLDEDKHIYLCPQTLFKFHPDMDDVLAGIAEQDEKSTIVLIDPVGSPMRKMLEERLTKRSPELAERLFFVPRQGHEKYLQLICCADVLLDTLHFNGQNTSLEGFAMGKPIVTLPGELQRSRHTYGMYQAMNYSDLVAASMDEYVSIAVALAANTQLRSEATRIIEERAPVLFRNQDFITECEKALAWMVKDTQAKRLHR